MASECRQVQNDTEILACAEAHADSDNCLNQRWPCQSGRRQIPNSPKRFDERARMPMAYSAWSAMLPKLVAMLDSVLLGESIRISVADSDCPKNNTD
jgi:hypothetical protein